MSIFRMFLNAFVGYVDTFDTSLEYVEKFHFCRHVLFVCWGRPRNNSGRPMVRLICYRSPRGLVQLNVVFRVRRTLSDSGNN